MDSLSDFTKKIEERFAADEERLQSHQRFLNRRHEVRKTRLEIYAKILEQVITSIIRPRIEKLVAYFENASLSSAEPNLDRLICRMAICPRFPATTTFDFLVSHDTDIDNIYVVYSLQIIPVFMKFDKQDTFSFSLSAVDESQLTKWVEEKLLQFLETYIQLEHIEQYQKQNLVYDPICNTLVNKAFAISESTPDSKCYYFCTEDCRAKFVLDAN